MKCISSSFTSGICGKCTHVEPHLDQHEQLFMMPHCITMMMAMLLRAHTMSFQKTTQNSASFLSVLSQAHSIMKLSNQILNL